MAQPWATLVDGKQIIYGDVVKHAIKTTFTWKQRIMILLGCSCITNTEIFLRHPNAVVVGQRSVSMIPWSSKKLQKAIQQRDKPKNNKKDEQKKGTTSGNT